MLSGNQMEITFELFGGYTGLSPDGSTETERYAATLTVDITDEWMTIMGVSGPDWFLRAGDILQKNFTPDLWEADVIGTMRAAAGN